MGQDSERRVHDELYKAVLLLASHTDSIQERLGAAYFSHLQSLDVAALPVEAQVQFDWIREQLKQLYPAPGKAHAVQIPTAVLLAQNIILLHYSLKWRQ